MAQSSRKQIKWIVSIIAISIILITISMNYSFTKILIHSAFNLTPNSPENNNQDSNNKLVCTPQIESAYPENVLISVHRKCPISEQALKNRSNILHVKQIEPSKTNNTTCKTDYISNTYQNIICPNDINHTNHMIKDNNMNIKKYRQRSESDQCNQHFGMWGHATTAEQKCYFLLGMEYMLKLAIIYGKQKPILLDWGCGCGHQIFWLYQYYNIYGYGLDLISGNIQYASQNFYNDGHGPMIGYCSGDGTDLQYIDNNTFDYIVSIAAIYHLPNDKQCDLVLNHFLRIIKVYGKMWIGWNGVDHSIMTIDHWEDCLKNSNSIKYEIVNDINTLGYSFYGWSNSFSIFITKVMP